MKTAKNDCFHGFSDEFLSENNFKAVLTTFCCYDYGANASEAVDKITTDQKDYHKCSLCVIVCCIAKAIVSSPLKLGGGGVLVFEIWTKRGVMKKLLRNRRLVERGVLLERGGGVPNCFISFP